MNKEPAAGKSAKTTSSTSKEKKPKTAAKTTKTKASTGKLSLASKTSKSDKKSNVESVGIPQQQRQDMIQEMAYLIAERRGFSGGNPTDDWLAAENQVDAKLLSGVNEA